MGVPSFALIITAAGSSERFAQGKVKKEYLPLEGKETVLERALLPFLQIPRCQIAIITCPKDGEAECAVALGESYVHQSVPIVIAEGGATRQESVCKALELLKSIGLPVEYVAIHDGARPFITEESIIKTIATASFYGGSAPAYPITDASKTINEEGVITSHLDKRSTVVVQTPQVFRYPDILFAHEKAKANGKVYVDDTEIYADAGYQVCVCPGERSNRKITYEQDIPDAKAKITSYLETREKGLQAKKATEELHKAMEESKERIRQ